MAKILLIEDDLPLLRMYQVAFARSGHTMLTATSGEEGLTVAQHERPNLILLDLVLPKKNGFEVLEALKKDPALAATPVICLTVLHQAEDQQRCRKLGAADFWVKTQVAPEQVVARALEHLGT